MSEFDRVKEQPPCDGAVLCAVVTQRDDGWYIVRQESELGPYGDMQTALDMADAVLTREDIDDGQLN